MRSDTGDPVFDFNTLIPMPKELDIEAGTITADSIGYYLSCIDPDNGLVGTPEQKVSKEEFQKGLSLAAECKPFPNPRLVNEAEQIDFLKKRYRKDLAWLFYEGKTRVENLSKHRAADRYQWCTREWGTKWNAQHTHYDGYTITFDTAWGAPIPVIRKLGDVHPDLRIGLIYADEDIGNHVGFLLMDHGQIYKEGTFRDKTRPCYEFAFQLWGGREEYRFDRKNDTYVSKPEKPLKAKETLQAEAA